MRQKSMHAGCRLIVAVLALIAMGRSAQSAERPNLLFIFLDDFGWRDTSYMGSDFFETPNLDRMATQGMRFTNAYSCAANCAPARACLLSGQYTPRHQIFNVGTGPRGNAAYRRLQHVPGVDVLRPDIATWAQQLQAIGYRTATIGKWHLSPDPIPYGFHINVGGTHSGSPPRGYYPPHNVPGLRNAPKDEYLTDRLTEESMQFIRQHRDQPWCLYLTHFAVHTPLDAKRELVAKYKAKPAGQLHDHVAMATMIQAVDDGVGKIDALLTELGLQDHTIVVFFSDNGGLAAATDMNPLRGYKGTYYEGGIRVPMFVRWPGVVVPDTVCEEPVIGVDLYPTFCEMTGAKMPNQPMDGQSLVPLLTGRSDGAFPKTRALFWHFPAYLQAGAGVESQECRDPLFRTRPCSIIRKGKWKLHEYFEDGGIELYDLVRDPGEQHNLADSQPAIAEDLHEQLKQWRRDIRAPVPVSSNPEFDEAAERAAMMKRKR